MQALLGQLVDETHGFQACTRAHTRGQEGRRHRKDKAQRRRAREGQQMDVQVRVRPAHGGSLWISGWYTSVRDTNGPCWCCLAMQRWLEKMPEQQEIWYSWWAWQATTAPHSHLFLTGVGISLAELMRRVDHNMLHAHMLQSAPCGSAQAPSAVAPPGHGFTALVCLQAECLVKLVLPFLSWYRVAVVACAPVGPAASCRG